MRVLADEICSCIDDPERQLLRGRPGKCLQRVAGKRRASIASTFQFDITDADDYQALIDSLVPYLANNCSVLIDYQAAREASSNWSDAPTERRYRYRATVAGLADLQGRVMPGERVREMKVTGVLTEYANNRVKLFTPEDEYKFYLAPEVTKRPELIPGQVYSIAAVWQLVVDEDAFAYVITDLRKQ